MSGLAQDGPPVPRQHKKYWTNRLGPSRQASFLDKRHKMRVQQMARNRGWTASALPGATRASGGRRSSSADVQSGSIGRGGFSQRCMSYKDLCNAMFPILRERRESRATTSGVLTSGPGIQAVDTTTSFFSRAALRAWYDKSSDAQNITPVTAVTANSQFDWVLMYLGGQCTYTWTNTCSHTIQLEAIQIKSKRYQTVDPETRWADDLVNDNTLRNTGVPPNTEASRSTLNYRPGKGLESDFRNWYQIIGTKRYTLEPGQTVYHTVKFAPFKMTGKQLNPDTFTINPKTQYTMFIQKGVGLVCDSNDTDVNIGSSASVGTRVERHQYRATFQYKGMQTYNSSTLSQVFTTENEFNVETEGLEGYTNTS